VTANVVGNNGTVTGFRVRAIDQNGTPIANKAVTVSYHAATGTRDAAAAPPRLALPQYSRNAILQGPAASSGALAPLDHAYINNIGRLRHGFQKDPNLTGTGAITWTPLFGSEEFTAEPALAAQADGRLRLVALNAAGDMWVTTQTAKATDAWGAAVDLGGLMASPPAVVRDPDGSCRCSPSTRPARCGSRGRTGRTVRSGSGPAWVDRPDRHAGGGQRRQRGPGVRARCLRRGQDGHVRRPVVVGRHQPGGVGFHRHAGRGGVPGQQGPRLRPCRERSDHDHQAVRPGHLRGGLGSGRDVDRGRVARRGARPARPRAGGGQGNRFDDLLRPGDRGGFRGVAELGPVDDHGGRWPASTTAPAAPTSSSSRSGPSGPSGNATRGRGWRSPRNSPASPGSCTTWWRTR
jgi:hypothetical protein